MAEKVRAAVSSKRFTTEMREFELPEIPSDAGLLKMEAAGVCGADWSSYQRDGEPRIMGHENVGYVAKIGPIAAKRWKVKEGDYITLQEYIPCGNCALCRSGDFRLRAQTEVRSGGLRYGSNPIDWEPSLWGGYSQYLYLHPDTVVHKLQSHVKPHHAAMAIPMSNGVQWAVFEAGAALGKSVLIQGPGQQGLSGVLAAKEAGAACVIVSGLTRDAHRLEIAQQLGADYLIDVEKENLVERVMDITGNEGVDGVVDVAGGPNTLTDGIACAKKGGTVVFATTPGRFQISRLTTSSHSG